MKLLKDCCIMNDIDKENKFSLSIYFFYNRQLRNLNLHLMWFLKKKLSKKVFLLKDLIIIFWIREANYIFFSGAWNISTDVDLGWYPV